MSQVQASGSKVKKTVPLWSLFLVALLVLGSVLGLFIADPQLANTLSPRPTGAAKDFTLSSSQTSMNVKQGGSGSAVLTLDSLNGFVNATGLSLTLSANGTGLLIPTLTPAVVIPVSGGRTNSTLSISVSYNAGIGDYPLTVSAISASRTHTIMLTVIVTPIADFAISALPSTMMIARGGTSSATVTLTSRYGFSGNVSLSETAPFALIGVAGVQSPLWLSDGGANSTILAVSTSNTTVVGTYVITVTGTSGSVIRVLQINVNVFAAASPRESLGFDSYSFTSGTNVTLFIRNFGGVSVNLVSYYVKDASGDQYALTGWSGPTINPNAVVPVNVLIGTSCSNCTLSGTAFTFSPGYSYTITFVTSRNNQFTFSVVR